MKQTGYSPCRALIYILFMIWGLAALQLKAQCGPSTPSFTANLVGSPTGTWISPSIVRDDTCCGSSAPDKCLKFTIFLDQNAIGINFDVVSGALPPGALFYQINCGPQIAVGTPICLSGPGPHILTFCKPGNNNNTYGITSIPAPEVPDSILVRNGCTATLAVSGFSVPTINWNSIPTNTLYNSYLSCTSGCATVVATPTGTPPAYVDYEVSGYAASPCQASFYVDTVRVYFYSDLVAGINPVNPTICFGNNTALLTVTVAGGLAPYTYSWSTGSNAQAITVGPGNYTVTAFDNTGCPPTTATAVVSQFILPISADPGPDQQLCKTNPVVTLNGTITSAAGGLWSGGTGTFAATTSLTTTYTPSAAELSAGATQLYFSSTGNSGCPPSQGTVNITFQNAPMVTAGPDPTVCANNSLANLSGTITGYPAGASWFTTGSGTIASVTSSATTYTPSAADIAMGNVDFVISTTNNGACPAASDTILLIIAPKPVVNAGSDLLICNNAQAILSGTVSGPTNTGTWTTSGDGSFSPNAAALNANYTPGPNDITTGTVSLILSSTNNGNCLPVTDTLKITIHQLAIVNAGLNQALCSNASSVTLNGSVSGGTTTGIWTVNGSGSFAPANTALNGAYSLTPADIAAGALIFTLTSTNNGPCPAVADTVLVTFQTMASVSSGSNQTICASQNPISLNGNIAGGAGTGSWTASGSGTFIPGNAVLNTSYSISASDVANGLVTFTLTSTNNGACPVVSDTTRIRIVAPALVNAGPNQSICSNASVVTLTGTISGGTSSGNWTASGAGSFNPGASVLNTQYALTPADLGNGAVTFTLSSTNNGPCAMVNDTVKIAIHQLASVNSGPNQILCSLQNTLMLNGNITGGAGTGTWSASGTGNFTPGNTVLNPSYSMTPADITAGFVNFTLTSTNNGPCPAISDSVKIVIRQMAVVNAGPDQQICSSQANVPLSGTITGATTSGSWSTNGTGTFASPGALNNAYTITSGDISQSTVLITLTSGNNGVCPADADTLKLVIVKSPLISLRLDTTICEKQTPFRVLAQITGSTGTLQWNSSGTGSFSPNNYTNPSNYNLTPADVSAGSVTVSLSALSTGPCGNVTSSMKINIYPSAKAAFTASSYTVLLPAGPVNFTNQSQNATSYKWTFGDGNSSLVKDPGHNYTSVGYYTVTLVANNAYGCSDTSDLVVTIIKDIQFPTAFTPNTSGSTGGVYSNGDYSNDVFFPYTDGVTDYDLMIFNRWGELIFRSTDIKTGWDGYFNGKLCQQDAYVWKANVKFFDGRTFNKTGSITLLR